MSKCNQKQCAKKSEVSSSDKSESKCDEECKFKQCECYSAEELACKFKDAVVNIQSEFILIGASGPAPEDGVSGALAPAPNVRIDVLQSAGGFFIKGHYIVTTASAVLMPPSLTSVVNRYPYYNPIDLTDEDRVIQNEMVRASRILVSVYNVNGSGHSFVYEADLVGVDGAGNIAVLRINYRKAWNFCNPCVEKCHPYFKFGKSRATKEGEKVYVLGDYVSDLVLRMYANGAGLITEGLVSDHRYADYSGYIFPELVLVSAPVYTFSSGLPIVNCQGQVIAMQATDVAGVNESFTPVVEGQGWVGGVSEFFMRRVVKTLIKGQCSRKPNCHLEIINDPVGPYYRYRKGFLGIAYELLTGINYDSVFDYTSNVDADVLAYNRRFRLTENGEFLSSPACKELIGIVVTGVAGLNPDNEPDVAGGLTFVAGGTGSVPLAEGLPVSPALNRLQPGDVITHIDNIPLGDLGKQIPPALITWRLCAGDQIELTYRRGGSIVNGESADMLPNYDNLFTISVTLEDFPLLHDYPWYAIDRFPLLANVGFDFPADQRADIQYPMRPRGVGGSEFEPAL